MTPTLAGRLQTRVLLLLTVGIVWTLVSGPLLAAIADAGASPGAYYRGALGSLAVVLMLGLGWELSYHVIQQYRWDKDWPTLFGLLTALPEGALSWLVVVRTDTLGAAVSTPTFLVHFVSTWLVMWATANGPLRVVLLRWRFDGGRIFGRRRHRGARRPEATHWVSASASASAAVPAGSSAGLSAADRFAAPPTGGSAPRAEQVAAAESGRGWGVAPVLVRGIVCAKCRGFNPLSVSHCVHDGHLLNATVASHVGSRGELVVGEMGPRPPLGVLTSAEGQQVRLDGDLVFGRAPQESPVVRARLARPVVVDPDDLGISRVHCYVDLAEWNVFVRDGGSINGTVHRSAATSAETRLESGQAVRLEAGDIVMVGAQWFVYSPHF